MTRNELAALLREIVEKPPGERSALLNVLVTEEHRALLSQAGAAAPSDDAFDRLLRLCLSESNSPTEDALLDQLAESLAAQQQSAPPPASPGDSTHLMSISSQPGIPAPPDEDTIRHQVRSLFKRLDGGL